MRTGRTILLVVGALLGLIGLATATAGAGALLAHSFARDADGFLNSPTVELSTTTAALNTDAFELFVEDVPFQGRPWSFTTDARLEVTPTSPGTELFVGVAPAAEVDAYLAGVDHEVVTDLRDGVTTRAVPGGEVTVPPADTDIWAASSTGSGTRTLSFDGGEGSWSVVVMEATGEPGFALDARAGVRTDALLPIGTALLVTGLFVLLAAALTIVLAVRDQRADGTAVVGAPVSAAAASPVRLRGRLDPDLSRGMWLVKWLLALPHLIVLAVLWPVFVVLTFVAGVAVLFTGRYPRGIFDLNVGILRWTWRVQYYATSVLGTDRYPPFSLAPADHPAELDIAYPERLSRGLVLVKWWLLVLPHYLVLAFLAGGALSWSSGFGTDEAWRVSFGGGLIGLLALVAGVVLLVTGRYPRPLFDLLMGFNRWVYRVVAYAALMTDEYPPFRLDQGGEEPPVAPEPPPPVPAPPATGVLSDH